MQIFGALDSPSQRLDGFHGASTDRIGFYRDLIRRAVSLFWLLLAGDTSGCVQQRSPIPLTEIFSSLNTGTKILVVCGHGFSNKLFGHWNLVRFKVIKDTLCGCQKDSNLFRSRHGSILGLFEDLPYTAAMFQGLPRG